VGRLDDIIARNKHPRRHRRARVPAGVGVALLVLIVLVLMVFTDLGLPPKASEPPPRPDGRVRGIELRHAPAPDASVAP
jgi:hypothetical protein